MAEELLQRQQVQRGWAKVFATPIEFYGQVIDENSRPVAAANISFLWHTSVTGESTRRTTSDDNGRFSLADAKGFSLSVQVQKHGYYTSKSNQTTFYYAAQGAANFKPDRNNPIAFKLQKMSESAEPLVHVEFPGFATGYRLNESGTPVEFDLLIGKQSPPGQGHIQVQFQRASTNRVFDWTWALSVPQGGVLEATQEFNFEAPLDGYLPRHEVTFSAGTPEWRTDLHKEYFLKLKDGTYGRISFRLLADNGFLRFESFVNPSGSRNLTYDPKGVQK